MRDRDLQHPAITELERNGYPGDGRPHNDAETECAWCHGRFAFGEETYTLYGEDVCNPCFEDWILERPLNELADEMGIRHRCFV